MNIVLGPLLVQAMIQNYILRPSDYHLKVNKVVIACTMGPKASHLVL